VERIEKAMYAYFERMNTRFEVKKTVIFAGQVQIRAIFACADIITEDCQ
jgi:hypothetical protein